MRFRELQAEKELRQLQEDKKNDRKPPPYKHIKVEQRLVIVFHSQSFGDYFHKEVNRPRFNFGILHIKLQIKSMFSAHLLPCYSQNVLRKVGGDLRLPLRLPV